MAIRGIAGSSLLDPKLFVPYIHWRKLKGYNGYNGYNATELQQPHAGDLHS